MHRKHTIWLATVAGVLASAAIIWGASLSVQAWATGTEAGTQSTGASVPQRANPAQPANSGTSTLNSTQTPVPDSAVTIIPAYVSVSWDADSQNPVSYRVERGMDIDGSVQSWYTLAEAHTTTRFADNDVVYKTKYQYRITPRLADNTTLAKITKTYTAETRNILAGRYANGKIELEFQADPLLPMDVQYVTIKEHPYNERSSSNAITLVDKRAFTTNKSTHSFTPAWATGTNRYYAIQLYTKIPPSRQYQLSTLQIPPIAIRNGTAEPDTPGTPSLTTDADGTVTITWASNNGAHRTAGYEILRRPARPINAWMPKHYTTTTTSLQLPDDTPNGPAYEYSVAPIKLDGTRTTKSGGEKQHPNLRTPKCLDPTLPPGAQQKDVHILYLLPDITALTGYGATRTLDLIVTDEWSRPCSAIRADDYYLQRSIYYKHTLDPSCPRQNLSCTLINEPTIVQRSAVSPSSGAVIENLTKTPATVWGTRLWQAIGFTDNDLKPGRYGMLYRACTVDNSKCSLWVDVPIHNASVPFIPFTSEVQDLTPITRPFDSGIVLDNTWTEME